MNLRILIWDGLHNINNLSKKKPNKKKKRILGKNPNNKFDKEMKTGRKMLGSFEKYFHKEEKTASYFVKIINDPLIFLEKFRRNNNANYVDISLNAIVPSNLR